MDMITLAIAKAYADEKQLARTETEITEVLPPTTIEGFSFNNGVYGATCSEDYIEEAKTALMEAMGIVDDQWKGEIPVTLEFDGEKSNSTAYYLYTDFYGDMIWVGNASLISDVFDNTGESFAVAFVYGMLAVMTASERETCTVAIYTETETVHPIDPKFIPAMDSITLNGADGKQYELSIDGVGQLAVTEKTT